MSLDVVIMALVAIVAAIFGIALFAGKPGSEAAAYRRRIAGTMLVALAAILGGFAFALQSWAPEP